MQYTIFRLIVIGTAVLGSPAVAFAGKIIGNG